MKKTKSTFALFFGNRGFFPASLIEGARQDMVNTLKSMGHGSIMMDKNATRHGAVETPREGEVFAHFLHKNEGKYDGVILCLPNFGDETGAVAALQDVKVPILVQAYPDELDKMEPALRRDAFCGKFSVMDVFRQCNVKFTALKPHTVLPSSERFWDHMDHFDRVCRVVNGFKNMVVGAIGARTTAFKTVRFDELALQKHGVTVETLDLADVFARMDKVSPRDKRCRDKAKLLAGYTCWTRAPKSAFEKLVRLGVVLDDIIAEYRMDALGLRCWTEMQNVLGVSPCVLLGMLNDRGVASACEVDVGNAVAMHALSLASTDPATCLDWNNNFGEDEDKCILFHCGPVPASMMQEKGCIQDHLIIANAIGKGKGFGCNEGRIKAGDCTFGSMLTEDGKVKFFLGEGRFTEDVVPENFFGCAGVLESPRLQDTLLHLGYNGFRHHVSVTMGHVMEPTREALSYYLGFDVAIPQGRTCA